MTDRRLWNEETEAKTLQELRPLQDEKLRRQVARLAAVSPFYREQLSRAGVSAEEIRNVDDLVRLPLISKDDLRRSQEAHPPLGGHACAPLTDVRRVSASSGTTGNPVLVGLTARDKQIWNELLARVLWCQGLRPGMVAWNACTLGFWISGMGFQEALEQLGATALPAGAVEHRRAFHVAGVMGARYMISTPSFAVYLAKYAREQLNLDVSTLGLQHMGLGAEPGAAIPEIRAGIQNEWGARVYDCMGTADFCPTLWTECSEQNGMHFMAGDYVFPELVDPDTGERLEIRAGVTGELICTAIDRECVPLLRYRVGDIVTVVDDKPCRCGRGSLRIRCLDRADNMFIVRGVNVYPTAVLGTVSRFMPEVTGEIRVVLKQRGVSQLPPVPVQVEMGEAVSDAAALKRRIEKAIRDELIFTAEVELMPKGTFSQEARMKRQLIVREG